MIFKRLILAPFSTGAPHKHHVKITELVKRMTNTQETFTKQQEDIKTLQGKVISDQIVAKIKIRTQ